MKRVILTVALITAISFTSCKTEAKKDTTTTKTEQPAKTAVALNESTFGVRGNCGMCKNTIETAAKNLEGVSNATWNKDKKEIKVAFDAGKTNLEAIHKAIAASGYDTDKIAGSSEVYQNLPGCCKYDHNMKMSQKEGAKEASHSDHAGH